MSWYRFMQGFDVFDAYSDAGRSIEGVRHAQMRRAFRLLGSLTYGLHMPGLHHRRPN
jgi:hypothetical protein